MMYVQTALWAIVGVVATSFVLRALWNRRKGRRVKPSLIAAATLAGVALLVVPAIGIVPAGHRGVVYEWSGGVDSAERGEGITLLIPWAQHMYVTSVRTQKVYSDKIFSQSLDLQEITAVVSINYHVRASEAADLYQEVGPLYPSTVIQPALFQRTKAAIGQVKAEGFAQRRAALAATIQKQLTKQLSSYGIVVEFVNIEDAIFDPAFVKAVKNKIIAEQKAQEQVRLIEAERAIKTQKIIQAEARARSIKIEADQQARANVVLAQSITPEILRWKWLLGWDGSLPITLVTGEKQSDLILQLP